MASALVAPFERQQEALDQESDTPDVVDEARRAVGWNPPGGHGQVQMALQLRS
jgi:hypothetical protein